jgi:hypothetical protein
MEPDEGVQIFTMWDANSTPYNPKHSAAEIMVVSAMAKFQQLGISESDNPPQGHQSKPSEEPIPVVAHLLAAEGFRIRRTKRGTLVLVPNRPIIPLRTISRSYAHGSESSSALLRQAGGCFAFHSGRQFCNVCRRAGSQWPRSGQGR